MTKDSFSIDNKIFVVTGTLPSLSRQEAKDIIQAHGGKVSSSISKKTDYLIVGGKAGSKANKAKLLGVKILDEKNFLEKINQ